VVSLAESIGTVSRFNPQTTAATGSATVESVSRIKSGVIVTSAVGGVSYVESA
jgi:hypothetical protein